MVEDLAGLELFAQHFSVIRAEKFKRIAPEALGQSRGTDKIEAVIIGPVITTQNQIESPRSPGFIRITEEVLGLCGVIDCSELLVFNLVWCLAVSFAGQMNRAQSRS